MAEQKTADDRSERSADDRQRPPDRNGDVAFPVILEGDADEGECRGHHRRRADRQKGPRPDQDFRCRRIGRHNRRDTEQHEADEEHAPVTDPVTQRPGAEQQAGHDEGVCVDDPQPLRCRRAKLARQGRQGRVEDRIVQNDKQETGGDGHQKNPAVRVGGRHDSTIQ